TRPWIFGTRPGPFSAAAFSIGQARRQRAPPVAQSFDDADVVVEDVGLASHREIAGSAAAHTSTRVVGIGRAAGQQRRHVREGNAGRVAVFGDGRVGTDRLGVDEGGRCDDRRLEVGLGPAPWLHDRSKWTVCALVALVAVHRGDRLLFDAEIRYY